MNAEQLQNIQKSINFDGPSMAICMGIDYEQYRRYYYGHTAIPDNIERAAMELQQINHKFIADAPARIDANIEKYGGINGSK